MVTNLALANTGHGTSASNTTAAAALAISVGNSSDSYPSYPSPLSQLFVLGIAIYSSGVTVTSITAAANAVTGWTFQGSSTDPTSGIRVECWTNNLMAAVSFGDTTINFSESTLASAVSTAYVEPQDFASSPLINNQVTPIGGIQNETIVYNPPITSGNLILISTRNAATFPSTISSITDSLGTTYTELNSDHNNNCDATVWGGLAAGSAVAGANKITLNWSGTAISTGSSYSYYISQWSGVTTTVDVNVAVGTGVNFITSSITTVNANDLIYALNAPTSDGWVAQTPGWYCFGGSDEAIMAVALAGTYSFYSYNNDTGNLLLLTALKFSDSYTPTAPPTPGTATANGTAQWYATGTLTPQTSGNIVVTVVGFASTSGDSFNQASGAIRASVVPTVASAAVAIIDNQSQELFTQNNMVRFNAERDWATFTFELVSGNPTEAMTDSYQITSSSTLPPVLTDHSQNKVNSFTVPYKGYQLQSTTAGQPYKPPSFEQTSGAASMYISAAVLQNGTTGVPYSETITANGGFSPYTYSILSGSLPTGLSLGASTGVVSGTPSATGTFGFTVKAGDSASNTASNSFSITIAVPASGGGSFVFLGG